jgi:hypothetical protein
MAADSPEDLQAHERSYSLFIWIIKWGAIVSVVAVLLLLLYFKR